MDLASSNSLRLFQRLLAATHPTLPDSVRLPATQEAVAMLRDEGAPQLLVLGADDVLESGNAHVLAAARPHFPAVAALRDASGHLDEDRRPVYRGGRGLAWHGATPNVDAAALLVASHRTPIASLWQAFEMLSLAVESGDQLPPAYAMMAVSLSVLAGLDSATPVQVTSRLRRFMAWRLSGTVPPSAARHLAPLDDALALLPAEEWADVWSRERRVLGLPALLRFAGAQATAQAILTGRFSHAKKYRLDFEPPNSLHQVFPIVARMPDLQAFESLSIDDKADALHEAMSSLGTPKSAPEPTKRRRSPQDAFSPEAEAKRQARTQKRLDAEAARLAADLAKPGSLGL